MRIALAQPFIGKEEANAVYQVVEKGWVSMGEQVSLFEARFAKLTGAKHAIATNNGTAALHLAVIASGIGKGDEVLIPTITFISTANVVMYEQARPVLVECSPETYNIDLADAEARITDKTKAIIVVDMNGLPVDYEAVMKFARRHSLQVISDSAESLGAVYKEEKVGSIAPIHIFSFFPNKNITTGEGGMITTDNDDIADLVRKLRNQGQERRYRHSLLGYNYRMSDIQAAIGLEQLKKLDYVLRKKTGIANTYSEAFEGESCLTAPVVPRYVDQHAWYMYTVSVGSTIDRDSVVNELAARGIDTRLSFPPIHIQPFYKERFGYTETSLPVSWRAWQQLINIPIWAGLSELEQEYVIDNLRDIILRAN